MMLVKRLLLLVSFAVILSGIGPVNSPLHAEDGYGTLTGKFVLQGDVPKPKWLIKGGKVVGSGKPAKNVQVCAPDGQLKSDALVVDEKGKGIGNVFVYLIKAPPKVHPDLKQPPKKKLKFDQKQCRFTPHAMFVRTGQTVLVLSDDNCTHNTHTYPLFNEGENFSLPPNFRKGVPLSFDLPEPLPMKVGCDIHPWMTAYWLILDHPYGAITVAEAKDSSQIGTFKIEKLPYGEYEFRVWHEKVGYVSAGTKRGFKVKIDKPEVKLDPFKVPVETFE